LVIYWIKLKVFLYKVALTLECFLFFFSKKERKTFVLLIGRILILERKIFVLFYPNRLLHQWTLKTIKKTPNHKKNSKSIKKTPNHKKTPKKHKKNSTKFWGGVFFMVQILWSFFYAFWSFFYGVVFFLWFWSFFYGFGVFFMVFKVHWWSSLMEHHDCKINLVGFAMEGKSIYRKEEIMV